MNKKIKAIVFDFDGVVVDSEPLYERAENRLLSDYGVQMHPEDWRKIKGLSEHAFFNFILERYGIPAEIEELKILGRQYLREVFARELGYMAGFVEFFGEIDGHYKIGLVTSSSGQLLQWIFTNTPIRNHFPNIVTEEDTTHGKPHPEPYLLMARRLEIDPAEMLVIEDSINGIRSALAAGARTIGFTSTLTKEDLIEAEYHAGSYEEIRNVLKLDTF